MFQSASKVRKGKQTNQEKRKSNSSNRKSSDHKNTSSKSRTSDRDNSTVTVHTASTTETISSSVATIPTKITGARARSRSYTYPAISTGARASMESPRCVQKRVLANRRTRTRARTGSIGRSISAVKMKMKRTTPTSTPTKKVSPSSSSSKKKNSLNLHIPISLEKSGHGYGHDRGNGMARSPMMESASCRSFDTRHPTPKTKQGKVNRGITVRHGNGNTDGEGGANSISRERYESSCRSSDEEEELNGTGSGAGCLSDRGRGRGRKRGALRIPGPSPSPTHRPPPYTLVNSIEFLSLLLPESKAQPLSCEYKLQQDKRERTRGAIGTQELASSFVTAVTGMVSKSTDTRTEIEIDVHGENETHNSQNDITSRKRGQTTNARSQVQETINCATNIDFYFCSSRQNSPRGVTDNTIHHNGQLQVDPYSHRDYDERSHTFAHRTVGFPVSAPLPPVNVDFVLESSEEELASFAHGCICSGRHNSYRDAIDIYDSILDHYTKRCKVATMKEMREGGGNSPKIDNDFDHDCHMVASTLHNLGVIAILNGNYNRALTYCKEALNQRRHKLNHTPGSSNNGGDYDQLDLNVAQSLSELGIIYYTKEDFNKSLGAMREALQIYSKYGMGSGSSSSKNALNCSHVNPESRIASILNNIGCIHFSMGKLASSLSTFEECLDLLRKNMGTYVGCGVVDRLLFNMSITLCNAATVASKQGNEDVAASWMEEGLIVQQSILPENHCSVLRVLKRLSHLQGVDLDVHEKMLNYEEVELQGSRGNQIDVESRQSEESGRRSVKNGKGRWQSPQRDSQVHVAILTDAQDLQYSSYCAELLTLGTLMRVLNGSERVKLQMAVNRLPRALLVEGKSKRHCSWVDIGNSNSNNKATNRNTCGGKNDQGFDFLRICQKAAFFVQRNETKKAIKLLVDIQRGHRNKCGDVNYILGALNHILGLIYLYTEGYTVALEYFKDAVRIRSSSLDPDHDDLLDSHSMIAISLIAMADFDGSLSKLQKVLHLTRKKYGYNNERVAVILNNIGICHYEYGGLLAASKTFEEAVEILNGTTALKTESQQGNASSAIRSSILIGRCLNNLAFIHFKRTEYSEAIVSLESALKVQRRVFGNEHVVVRQTVECLATCMAIANCGDKKERRNDVTKIQ